MPVVINVPADQPTLTAAIAAAAPFDTIRVAPGTYNETVVVNKTIQLLGAQAGVDARTRPGLTAAESIVTATNANGTIQVTADRVVVDGFTVQNNTTGPGIATSASFSGYWIFNNIIRNNTFGLFFNSSGAGESQARRNRFSNNNQAGAASGNAIYSQLGSSNMWIDNNFFSGHAAASINFTVPAPTQNNIIISNNRMAADNSIALSNTVNVKIADNVFTNSLGSSIFFGGGTNRTDIEGNVLQTSVSNGINVTTVFTGTPNANIRAKNNIIQGNVVSGLNVAAGAYTVGGANLRLDATNNWWGSPSGPAPIGTGDAVIDPSGIADVVPFLTSPPFAPPIPQAVLSTGPIHRTGTDAQTIVVDIVNDNVGSPATVEILAFDLSSGNKVLYAQDLFSLPPLQAASRSYFVSFVSVYEIQFGITGTMDALVSVWSRDADGRLIAVQRLAASEEQPISAITPVTL